MKKICWILFIGFTLLPFIRTEAEVQELQSSLRKGKRNTFALHPDNPRYFVFRNRPCVLVTSGEHYGALINKAFDIDKYLETLHKDRLNNTRVFIGAYLEPRNAFNIVDNTLAPLPENYLSPWSRSEQDTSKFDLSKWNSDYFKRLHQLLKKASKLNIIVELTLFCPMYDDSQWNISPMNIRNNVNGIGNVRKTNVYTLDGEKELLQTQEALVRKIASEVNKYDNFYFEICNEPYFGGVTQNWQERITDVIVETEKNLAKQHLISVNVANGTAVVNDPHPAWSIFNFHYCTPPVAISQNAHLNKPIGMNETGFRDIYDEYYRREAWAFMLSGGALYNNLDYSFTVGKEDGTNIVTKPTPGGGSPALRKQLGAMKRFIESFNFIKMSPVKEASSILRSDTKAVSPYIMSEPGKQYAFYFPKTLKQVELDIPAGTYRIRILDPCTLTEESGTIKHTGGLLKVPIPDIIQNELVISLIKK